MRRQLAFIALSIVCLYAHAGVNKWVDADGNVVYSDTRPADDTKIGTVRNVAGKAEASAQPAGQPPKSYAEREADMKKAKQEKVEAEQKKNELEANTETRRQNCNAAKENARTLEEGGRIATYGEDGERTYIDDSAREQRLANARKAITENCD